MDTESQRIYDRMTLHHLTLAHPHWTPAQLATAVGRSERWARKWMKRFQSGETADYKMYLSHSRAPKTRPRRTSEVVKDVICELRETLSESYHRPAGAKLIGQYLRQEARLDPADHFIPTSSRTITQIGHLTLNGKKRTPTSLSLRIYCEAISKFDLGEWLLWGWPTDLPYYSDDTNSRQRMLAPPHRLRGRGLGGGV